MKHQSKAQIEKQKKARKNAIIICSLLVVLIIAFLCIKVFNNNSTNVTQSNSQEEKRYGRGINLPSLTSFDVPANVIDIGNSIDLYNPSSNFWYVCKKCGFALDDDLRCINEDCKTKYSSIDKVSSDSYYLQFSLYLKDNDELLFQSELVEPGKHIESVTLSRSLEEGTYPAYVFVQPYESDKVTPCNNGKIDVALNVK